MRELYFEDGVDMARDGETLNPDTAQEIRDSITGRHVCPFCGAVRDQADGVCPRCTMDNSASARQATKSRIGPWYVLQTRNPAAPGMKFETLLAFVHKGRIKPRTIVRGPTTHQLWKFAAQVKGLSREMGVCHSCGGAISRSTSICPHCNRPQDPPANPDVLLESQDAHLPQGPIPIYREVSAAPMLAEDAHVPGAARKGADGFLTAADLAAAFKLDFQPKGKPPRKPTVAPLRAVEDAGVESRRPRRWGRIVVLLLLLAAVGAGAFQFHRNPQFRAKILHGYDVAFNWSKQKWTDLKKPAPAVHRPAAPVNVIEVVPPSAALPHASSQPAEPASKPSPWDAIYHQSDSSSKPAPADEAQPAAAPPAEGTLDDVRALYRAAIDAEAQGDYSMAVKNYQQIERFSPALWPRDLKLRLQEARRQLK